MCRLTIVRRNIVIFLLGMLSIFFIFHKLYNFVYNKTLEYVPKDGSIVMQVYSYADLVDENNVGNEWDTMAKVNAQKLNEYDSLQLEVTKSDVINISAGARERDQINDVGFNNSAVKINDLNLSKKNFRYIEVKVRENRGRYAGNIAIYKFTFVFERIIELQDILLYLKESYNI